MELKLTTLAKERLLKLCEYMEQLPPSASDHFNMRDFLLHEGDHAHKASGRDGFMTSKDLHTCGTTACALGWAATMPYFKRRGLRLDQDGSIDNDFMIFDLSYSGREWQAFFGGHNRDQSPKSWAKRARRLVKASELDEENGWQALI